ncbi:hypothetical protein GP486_005509 [Trichoglossum hirsutum]|uniref:Uncharacterized protein n=1 Tax=Trichoglossum hirsutum TaxID=265104 RepID=A0A9P8L939_9PEZI|nr:hypothetical protein GP486_005509 [Trichoglossum hirsutum]
MSTSSKGKEPVVVSPVVNVVGTQQPLAIVKPKMFGSKEEDVELFVLQLRAVFRLQADRFKNNQAKTLYASSLMEGRALE